MEGDGVAAVADIRATQRARKGRAAAVNRVARATRDRQGPSHDRRVAPAPGRRTISSRVLSGVPSVPLQLSSPRAGPPPHALSLGDFAPPSGPAYAFSFGE